MGLYDNGTGITTVDTICVSPMGLYDNGIGITTVDTILFELKLKKNTL